MQEFNQMEVTLKNDQLVTIRQAKVSDAANLLHAIKTYIPQSEYIPKFEEEIRLTIKQEEEWIQSFISSNNSLLLVAEHDNEIIGNIDLTGHQRKAMEHTAVIGMGMIAPWRNTGLGTAMMEAIIDWAKQNSILELIWLQVYTENVLGLGLYKKMGFTENGIIKNFFKHNEKYFDNLTMSLSIK